MTTPPTNPEHEREGALLNAALEVAAGDRATFLDTACAGDVALRQRLEKLLEAHEEAGAFLDEPAFPVDGMEISRNQANRGTDSTTSTVLSEGPGDRIGRYKLLEKIGEGGCGIVYMAEQSEPICRRVALKVIKFGMDTRQVIARFEAERQALALMDHPNIARVLDAGATDAGRPFFIMELVRGIRITDYCDQKNLSPRERLGLFIQVCRAIQHAHQKGVIHRDIKPSNILVTVNDGAPTPKVIDFGIAKATNQQPLTNKTLFTAFEQFIGTPAYMSPEQTEMTSQDIDTRSDIYALGVLLYELLTGQTPFDATMLQAAGLEEMRRIIREQEPVRPSTRLSSMMAGELVATAKHRHAEPPTLIHLVRGDLDWVVMKCLEKDRKRRYETANELAWDIERHLKHEPVVARPPRLVYRLEKSFRRNRVVVTAAGLVALALVAGAGLSAWQAVRATHARRDEAEARIRADVAARLAESQQKRAEEEERKAKDSALYARQEAYASDMNLAQQVLMANDFGHARRLLDRYRLPEGLGSRPGQTDLRGWEWRYLWRECQDDAMTVLCRYSNSVYSAAFSSDGQMLAVAGQGVDLWEIPYRKRIASLQPTGNVVAFSRSNLLAANIEDSNAINIWEAGTTNLIQQIRASGIVKVLRFSRDGKRLASLSHTGEVTVWEVGSWTVVREIQGPPGYGGHDGALDFSPDSRAVVFGHAQGHLQVESLDPGSTHFAFSAHPELITAVAWSPTAPIIASGSGFSGGPIRLWEASSGKAIGSLEGHSSWITRGLTFSADGRRLYSASGDQTIKIWDVPQQRCLTTLHGSSDELYGLALSPDGTLLASASKDGIVALWGASPDAREEQPRSLPREPVDGAIFVANRAAFAPDGRMMAEARGGMAVLRALPSLSELETISALGTNINAVTYSPDGEFIVSASTDGWLRVWSCGERRLVQALPGQGSPYLVEFSANGSVLIAMEWGEALTVWDTRSWQRINSLGNRDVESASTSPDGRRALTGNSLGQLTWWDTQSGKRLAVVPCHQHAVTATAFSPDGTTAASVAGDGSLALWDVSKLAPIAKFKGHMLGIHSVAFSPDQRRLATGGGSGREAVKLWDLTTRREMLTLKGNGSVFNFVAFSPDGNWLMARSSVEGRLHLWRAPSWTEIEAAEKRVENKTR